MSMVLEGKQGSGEKAVNFWIYFEGETNKIYQLTRCEKVRKKGDLMMSFDSATRKIAMLCTMKGKTEGEAGQWG